MLTMLVYNDRLILVYNYRPILWITDHYSGVLKNVEKEEITMEEMLLCESEYRIMSIIWDNEPVESGKLVKLCNEELDWKKSTTYTMLRKLCDKNIVKNENSVVSAIVKKENVQQYESERVVKRNFGGSLPAFLTAFLGNGSLSKEEASELINLIEQHTDEK